MFSQISESTDGLNFLVLIPVLGTLGFTSPADTATSCATDHVQQLVQSWFSALVIFLLFLHIFCQFWSWENAKTILSNTLNSHAEMETTLRLNNILRCWLLLCWLILQRNISHSLGSRWQTWGGQRFTWPKHHTCFWWNTFPWQCDYYATVISTHKHQHYCLYFSSFLFPVLQVKPKCISALAWRLLWRTQYCIFPIGVTSRFHHSSGKKNVNNYLEYQFIRKMRSLALTGTKATAGLFVSFSVRYVCSN